jgi:hypothetical protein
MSTAVRAASPSALQSRFLTLLPRIERYAHFHFRHLRCPHRKAEALAEVRALAWLWFLRLDRQGRDAGGFVSALATFAARAVHSGRRLCGHERARDVLSPRAQRRHGFAVEALPASTCASHERRHGAPRGQQAQDALEERLRDNTQTPPPEQAAFRIDFPAWRRTRTDRDRRLLDDLLAGERTQDVGRRYGLSPARVSQLRRDFHDDWRRFHGDGAPEKTATA